MNVRAASTTSFQSSRLSTNPPGIPPTHPAGPITEQPLIIEMWSDLSLYRPCPWSAHDASVGCCTSRSFRPLPPVPTKPHPPPSVYMQEGRKRELHQGLSDQSPRPRLHTVHGTYRPSRGRPQQQRPSCDDACALRDDHPSLHGWPQAHTQDTLSRTWGDSDATPFPESVFIPPRPLSIAGSDVANLVRMSSYVGSWDDPPPTPDHRSVSLRPSVIVEDHPLEGSDVFLVATEGSSDSTRNSAHIGDSTRECDGSESELYLPKYTPYQSKCPSSYRGPSKAAIRSPAYIADGI
ncbi:hypothetical protein C8Q77DRAFT_751871 [Trametes polyzona]|nr:hypothetical protein C8Q77DRAFT_751871 [Trametes polyzona]